MTWQANGNYYTFRQETITSYAPSASGVYGLYNRRHQILIGNSANIKDALLRHLRETHFRFRRFMPTGFVFEVLPAELRDLRAQELIGQYNPILQGNNSVGFGALWRSWSTPTKLAFQPQFVAKAKAVDISNSAHDDEKGFRCFQLDRRRFAILATTFGVILLAFGLTMVASHRKDPGNILSEVLFSIENWISNVRRSADIAWLSSPGSAPGVPKPLAHETKVFETNIAVQVPQGTETATEPIQTEISVISDGVNGNGLKTDENQIALIAGDPKAGQDSKFAKKKQRTNSWTVQAMATTDRQIASHWLEHLKAKGYEAFVVKADVKGRTWYRIRAGHVSTLKEAETLRTALRSKEKLQDAFIAANTEPQILIALNPKEDPPK